MVRAGQGELPLILRVPLEKAHLLAQAAAEAGVSAISLGPPRGALPAENRELVSGRLYGPGIFPLAMQTVQSLSGLGVPLIAAGGVYHPSEAEVLQSAGAAAVQIDAALWGHGDIA